MNQAIHPVSARTSPFSHIARQGVALAVAGLCWAASTAQAVGLEVTHGSGYPDSTASVSFELDFNQGAPVFDFFLQLDDPLPVPLTFRGGSASWNGQPLNDVFTVPAALTDASGTWGPNYTAGLALSADPLYGLLRLTYTYDLAGLSVGQSAVIGLTFEYFDSDEGDFVTLSRTASVTAVPEADAGLLALAGLGVATGVLARRRARDRTQHGTTPQDAPALA